MLFPNGANRNKKLQFEMAMKQETHNVVSTSIRRRVYWGRTDVLYNILLVLLTEKCMLKEHKNVEFKNVATKVSNQ